MKKAIIDVEAVTIGQLESLTTFDRDRIARQLQEAGMKATAGPNGSKRFPLKAALETLYHRGAELSPSDQRALAQAEKAKVETAILREEFVLIDEAVKPHHLFTSRVREIIDESDFPLEVRCRIVDLWRERGREPYW